MSKFLVLLDGEAYANDELYIDAVAGGERTFAKILARKEAVGKPLFDQVLYPLTAEQRAMCEEYNPVVQDFDEAYRHLNVVPRDTVRQIKKGGSDAFPGASVVSLPARTTLAFFKYRHVIFFKVQDFKEARKYPMVPKMAAVKVCGRLYAAINAVNVCVEAPIIVTVDD